MRSLVPKQIAPVHESQPGINAFVAEVELASVAGAELTNSKAGGERISLLFQNHRQTAVKLVWVDETGARREYGEVKGASRRLMKTFSGHTWLLLDENSQVIGHVVAPGKPARVKID